MDIGTDNEGTFIGIPNTAAPGGLFYRRDLAKEYLGTDDPEEIAAMMPTWQDFIEVGKDVVAKSGGSVSMIPGMDSLVYPMVNQPFMYPPVLLISNLFFVLQYILKTGTR